MDHPQTRISVLITVLLATGLACNFSRALEGEVVQDEQVALAVARTLSAAQTATAAAQNPTSEPEQPTATPVPSETPTPTITLTPTSSVPQARLTQNTNCRTGPERVYDLIRTFLIGESAEIIGKNSRGDYYYVTDGANRSRDCWLWDRYVEVSGDISQIPVFTPPPTPTPTYDWAGTWESWADSATFTMTLTQSGDQISGSFTYLAQDYSIVGVRGSGGQTVTGTLTREGSSDTAAFTWEMLDNRDQFTGNLVSSGSPEPWCGARNGAAQPSPCLGP